MKPSNKLFRDFSSLVGVQIANYVFPLISIPIVTRIIGPDKFGVINYAAAFIGYFVLLIGYGFDLTATRRLTQKIDDKELRNQVFNEVLSAKFFLFAISALLFIGFVNYLEPLTREKQVSVYSFLFCIATVLTQNWLFQAMQELPKVAILNLISKVIFTCLILVIVREKDDYVWQPLILSLTQIGLAAGSFVWAYKRFNLKIRLVGLKRIFSLINQEKMVFFSMVVINLYTTTNIVLLGLLQNASQVGYYTAGQKLIEVASSVINLPLAQALYPFIGKAFAESKESGIGAVQKLLPPIVITTILAGIGMFLIGPFVLIWFYGKAFEPSIVVFRILTVIPFLVALSNVFGIQIMLNLNMDKRFFSITAGGAIIGVLLNVLTVSKLGYVGTALNWVAVEIYITICMYWFVVKKGIQPFKLSQFSYSTIKNQIQPISARFYRTKNGK